MREPKIIVLVVFFFSTVWQPEYWLKNSDVISIIIVTRCQKVKFPLLFAFWCFFCFCFLILLKRIWSCTTTSRENTRLCGNWTKATRLLLGLQVRLLKTAETIYNMRKKKPSQCLNSGTLPAAGEQSPPLANSSELWRNCKVSKKSS